MLTPRERERRFSTAWERHHEPLRRFVRRRVDDTAIADDLVQEAFARLLRVTEWPDAVGAWLMTTARRLVIDHYRARRPLEALDDEVADMPEPDEATPFERLSHCLPAMLARLPEPYRSAVASADLEGVAQQAVAKRQGISLSGAKSRVQRGRRLLAAAYRDCCTFERADGGALADFSVRQAGACVLSAAGPSSELGMNPTTTEQTVMKQIAIEWRHLDVDGATCERCGDTGAELRQAVGALNAECAARGVYVTLDEVRLGPEDVGASNSILVDGRPLESLLPEGRSSTSPCTSCDDLIGSSGTECRTVDTGGARYETVPAALVREAVCRVADCCAAGCGCG